jgi:hypothetical protein
MVMYENLVSVLDKIKIGETLCLSLLKFLLGYETRSVGLKM